MIAAINHKAFSLKDLQFWPDRAVEILNTNDCLDPCLDRYCALLPDRLAPNGLMQRHPKRIIHGRPET